MFAPMVVIFLKNIILGLLFAPAVYREDGSGEDFEYLKYYGYRLSEELEPVSYTHLDVYKRQVRLDHLLSKEIK